MKNINLYKLIKNFEMDSYIKSASKQEVGDIIQGLDEDTIILMYYKLQQENKIIIKRQSYKVHQIIKKIEKKYTFLNQIENIICLEDCKDINKYKIQYSQFARDMIIIHNQKCQLINIIYATDIFNTPSPKDINTYNTIYINNTTAKCSKLKEDALINFSRVIILDKYKRPLGAININIVMENYDLYINNANNTLSIVHSADYQYVISVTMANIITILISSFMLSMYDINPKAILVLTMLRCIDDSITLMIIDDELPENKINMLTFLAAMGSSIIFTISIYLMYFDISFAIKSGFLIFVISYINSIIIRYIFNKFDQTAIILIIIMPEIIASSSIILPQIFNII